MGYALAADAVMLAHFLFIAFAVAGSFLLLKWPRLIWLHVPAMAWGAYIEISGNICPLTYLENDYRALAGEGTYRGGFIAHYLEPIIYPVGFTRGWAFVALAVLLGVNALGYWLYFRQRRARARLSAAA